MRNKRFLTSYFKNRSFERIGAQETIPTGWEPQPSSLRLAQLLHQPVGEFDARVEITDLVPLIAAVHADIVNVTPTATDAITRYPGLASKNGITGCGRHIWDHHNARPHRVHHPSNRGYEAGIGRRSASSDYGSARSHRDTRIGDRRFDCRLSIFHRFIRHDAALNGRRGAL